MTIYTQQVGAKDFLSTTTFDERTWWDEAHAIKEGIAHCLTGERPFYVAPPPLPPEVQPEPIFSLLPHVPPPVSIHVGGRTFHAYHFAWLLVLVAYICLIRSGAVTRPSILSAHWRVVWLAWFCICVVALDKRATALYASLFLWDIYAPPALLWSRKGYALVAIFLVCAAAANELAGAMGYVLDVTKTMADQDIVPIYQGDVMWSFAARTLVNFLDVCAYIFFITICTWVRIYTHRENAKNFGVCEGTSRQCFQSS